MINELSRICPKPRGWEKAHFRTSTLLPLLLLPPLALLYFSLILLLLILLLLSFILAALPSSCCLFLSKSVTSLLPNFLLVLYSKFFFHGVFYPYYRSDFLTLISAKRTRILICSFESSLFQSVSSWNENSRCAVYLSTSVNYSEVKGS